ncbi:MAG: FtsK/SpoIIIE domain-containing protein, partial [Butyricicoccaceae bacterium]
YNGIPHLLIPVVTDPKKAAGALNWAVGEMMRRYKLLAEYNVRSLDAYNEEVRRRGEDKTLPQIVIIIDELADLMMVAAKEVEESIARIAQMARAAGMHLIVATQRPSTDVITGLMKANIPSRISFAVASQIESRIILDQTGAEKLIGRGDMLYNPLGAGKPLRVQGTFISSPEVESVIDFVKNTSTAEYSQEILDHIERQAESKKEGAPGGDGEEADDPLLMDAISVVVDRGEASTSLLQRRLKLGYARAARLIDIMEERGIVGPYEGSKPRAVLLTRDQWSEMQLRMRG